MKGHTTKSLPDFLIEAILCHLQTEPSHAACFLAHSKKDFHLRQTPNARCAAIQLTLDFADVIRAVLNVDYIKILARRRLIVRMNGTWQVDETNMTSCVTDLVVWRAITRALSVKGQYIKLVKPSYTTWGDLFGAVNVNVASAIRRHHPHLMLARRVARTGLAEASTAHATATLTGPHKRPRRFEPTIDHSDAPKKRRIRKRKANADAI